MFGTDCCDVVAQVFVCCSQEGRVVLVDFCDTHVLLVGTSMGLSLKSSLKHMYFISIFMAFFPASFVVTCQPPIQWNLALPHYWDS